MSEICPHSGCTWQMPDNTPDSLAMYVVAMHRAYDCPEVVAAPSGADRDAAERRRAVP